MAAGRSAGSHGVAAMKVRTQFLRFLAVGLLNAGFGYLVFTASILVGLPAPLA